MKHQTLILFVSTLSLAPCGQVFGKNTAVGVQKMSASGINLNLEDKSVAPGDDFDKYANGAWEKSAQIPSDKSNISSFSVQLAITPVSQTSTRPMSTRVPLSEPASRR
jgi:hypothetical protein